MKGILVLLILVGFVGLAGFTGTVHAQVSHVASVELQSDDSSLQDVEFSANGMQMYSIPSAGDDIYEYALTTPFDITSATLTDTFSVAAQETAPRGVAFSATGNKMFVTGGSGSVHEYSLGTNFDASTATFTRSFSVLTEETFPEGLTFSNDGTKMFILGTIGDSVHEYTLTTGFDVSTATLTNSLSILAQDSGSTDITFSNTGDRMFIAGFVNDQIYEYSLGTPFDVSTATFIDNTSVLDDLVDPSGIDFNSSGDRLIVAARSSSTLYSYQLTSSFNLSSVLFVDSTPTITTGTSPQDMVFSATGNKMFTIDATADAITEYDLSTNFDVSTANFTTSFSVAAQDTNPRGLAFSATGDKMFVVGNAGDDVNEYDLSTNFDVSTANFTTSFSVAAQDTNPRGLAFSATGDRMFVGGNNGDVHIYSLDNVFDLFIPVTLSAPVFATGGGSTSESSPPSIVAVGIGLFDLEPELSKRSYKFDNPMMLSVGEPISFSVTLNDNLSSDFISHFEICLNKQISNRLICDSDTQIVWDRSIHNYNQHDAVDPNDLITVNSFIVSEDEDEDKELSFDFELIFDDVMDTSDIQIYGWDTRQNAFTFTFENALTISLGSEIVDVNSDLEHTVDSSTSTQDSSTSTQDSSTSTQDSSTSFTESSAILSEKKQAVFMWAGYSDHVASDSELITLLADDVPPTDLPNWTKNLGKFIFTNEITMEEFEIAILYLADMRS